MEQGDSLGRHQGRVKWRDGSRGEGWIPAPLSGQSCGCFVKFCSRRHFSTFSLLANSPIRRILTATRERKPRGIVNAVAVVVRP